MDKLGVVAETRKGEAGGVGKAGRPRADHPDIRRHLQDLRLQAVAECFGAAREIFVLERQCCRLTEADDAGKVFRAGTLALLLRTALKESAWRAAFAADEGADALRAADFVCGKTERIRAKAEKIDRDLAGRLDGVDMQLHVEFMCNGGDLGYRLTTPVSLLASITANVAGR